MLSLSEILGLPKSNASAISGVPAQPGIYFFIDDSEIIYIGETINLNGRMLEHRKLLAYNITIDIHLLLSYRNANLSDSKERKALESALIKRFKPALNIKGNTGYQPQQTQSPIDDLVNRGYAVTWIKNGDTGYVKIKHG